jgi:hypothetical protein
VKKAQHGGRFDSVDFAPSSLAASSSLRRSQQTVHDLTCMNTQDHVQRSMQRQGSAVLSRGIHARPNIAGRPIFNGDGDGAFASASASSLAVFSSSSYRLDRNLAQRANSPSSSPRPPCGATTTTVFGLHVPRRPATAHPSRSLQRPASLDVNPADTDGAIAAANGSIAAPQTPDVSQHHDPNLSLDAASNPSPEQASSQQASHASPLSSSRSKR